ncbi:MAG: S8 family serine peptidase, partial [Chloroflexota bacterium]
MLRLEKLVKLKRISLLGITVMLLGLLLTTLSFDSEEAQAKDLTPPALIKKIIDRHDVPVASGAARRTWTWGEFFAQEYEPYQEAPDGSRQVFYYDKGRLEITNPQADPNNDYYATSGLLLRELITGQVQLGDSKLSQREPAKVVLAGDNPPLLDTAPTYADLQELVSFDGSWKSSDLTGQTAGFFLTKGGTVDSSFISSSKVKYAQYDPTTGHNIADIFVKFMNSSGPIFDGSRVVNGPLYNPLYVFGRPISEPYWTQVTVSGIKRYVLIQAFERRLLTYTPENSPEFQVELGNIGRAYYQWRYGQPGPIPALDPGYQPPTSNPAIDFYNKTTKNLNGVKSVQFSEYTNFQEIITIQYQAPNKRYYLEQYPPCGLNGYYAEIAIETRVFFNCLVNNQPTQKWTYVDLPTPFRWPQYGDIPLNELNSNYSLGPDTKIGTEPVKNIITTGLDLQGFNRASIIGISVKSGLPLEGSTTYEADGKKQVFNTRYDRYNQPFNLQPPSGAVPYDPFQVNNLTQFSGVRSGNYSTMFETVGSSVLPQAEPGELLVKFKEGQFKSLAQVEGYLGWDASRGLLQVKPEATGVALAQLQANPQVEYAEPNYRYNYSAIREPNDARYPDQWYLKAIKLPRAWSLNTGQFLNGANFDQVKVAVIDSGVNVSHPDLQASLVGSSDVFDGTHPNDDPVGHGTLVAGIISAQGDNNQFGAGINWRTKLFSYRAGDRRGVTCSAVSEALRKATDEGVRVINLSLGGYQRCQTMADAIDYAFQKQ